MPILYGLKTPGTTFATAKFWRLDIRVHANLGAMATNTAETMDCRQAIYRPSPILHRFAGERAQLAF
jgi:hypothetical protein